MKTKHLLSVLILGIGIVSSFLIASNAVKAQTPSVPAVNPLANVQYPIPELGNCGSEAECKTYCDNSAHLDACLSFAKSHNLMSAGEIQAAKKFAAAGKGPGGCATKDSCNQYCENASHIDECVAFAEKNDLMSQDQLAEAKQVQAAIKKGAKLPACNGKDACEKYCTDPAHVEECMSFAKAAGFMTPEEAQSSDKVIAAIKKGVKPPACRGSECDKYCSDPVHAEECIAFSEAAGMMTPQEAGMARKTGGKGPGGCVGKEQCDAFCNDSANQQICFSFGKDNGLIPPDQLQKMEDGKKQFTESLKQAPPQVLSCISGVVGADSLDKFKNGTLIPPKDIGEKVGECFRLGMVPGDPGEGGNIPPGDGTSAGQNPGDAKSSQPGPGNINPGGQMMPQQAGPGGCKTPEECQSFCTSNPDVCKNFRPSGEPREQSSTRIEMRPGQPGQAPACVPGTQCEPGPNNIPGSAPAGQPGTFIQNQPGSFEPREGRMQPQQPGAPEGGTPPSGNMMQRGTNGGPATQQFQQQQQQFQSPPQSGVITPPPPAGFETPPPPPDQSTPPAGGSLLEAVKSFFNL